MFALPGLTAAGNVHCQLPVNSAFFTFYWTNWLGWIFSSTPLSALQEPLPPKLTFEHSSNLFSKGPLPVTGLLWVLTVLALWKRWKLQHLEIIINVVGLPTKYRSIGLKKDLRSSRARRDGSFDSSSQESQWIGADDSIHRYSSLSRVFTGLHLYYLIWGWECQYRF